MIPSASYSKPEQTEERSLRKRENKHTCGFLRRIWGRFAPPPILTVSEWSERYRVLSPESCPMPGPWRNERTPFLKEIMDAVNDPAVETIVVMASSQVGKSEVEFNVIGYFIDQDPSPLLLVEPTCELAQAISKDRIGPMIRDTPCLNGKVVDEKSRKSGNTILNKKFAGGSLTLIGANSPTGLASRPIRVVLADEVDRYPLSAGEEGDPLTLAWRRTNNFWNRKRLVVSTPTIDGISRIAKLFDSGTQEFFYIPCPSCGHYQRFYWKRLDFDTLSMPCENCGAMHTEFEWKANIQKGKWIATFPERRVEKKIRSFHIFEMYSMFRRWSEMRDAFLDAKHDGEETLKTFVNTSLGETWKIRGDAPDWERLFHRREDYAIGEVPGDAYFLTAGADVQKDRIEVEITAWGRDKVSWSIEYDVFAGDTADINSDCWRNLDNLMNHGFPHESGITMSIQCLAIDTGYNTQVVYNWCRKYPITRVIPVKGFDSLAVALGQSKGVDIYRDGKRHKHAMKLWGVGVSVLKSELYGWLQLDKPELGHAYPAGYCHFPQYEEEYFKQLTAETLVKHESRLHQPIYEWEKIRERNEALDCRVYSRAAAAFLQIDRYQSQHWDQMEAAIWPEGRNKAHPVEVAVKPDETVQQVAQTRRPQKPNRVLSRGIRL